MKQNEVPTDNSVVIAQLQEENEELKDRLDALNMTHLSQVSLWKSNYELSEKNNKNFLSVIDEQSKLINKMNSLLLNVWSMRTNPEELKNIIDEIDGFLHNPKS